MSATLTRTLGIGRAIMIGLASMIGAGVFYVWAPAADAAGTGLLAGLAIAAVVATLNALSSAQLAMAHPVSGGAYAYGNATIGPWVGFSAGFLFLAGKTASAGAISLIVGQYLWPEFSRPVAVAVIAVLAIVNMTGIRSTAAVSTVLVSIVFAGLAGILVAGLSGGHPTATVSTFGSPYGVLQSAGLLFFCFAGYARMATLGEEVRDPRRTLPRAILIALAIVLVVYSLVGIVCLQFLGTRALAASSSPLADLASPDWAPIIRVLAAIACVGSLIGVLAGLSRTSLAMARGRDLPGVLAHISPRTNAPVASEVVIALLAIVGILFLNPAAMVSLSACCVLGYYAIAQASAFRQPAAERWLPRAVQVFGLVGCLLLAFTVDWRALVGSVALLVVGLLIRAVARDRVVSRFGGR